MPGEVLIGEVPGPGPVYAYEVAGVVRVAEPDILAHKNTRDEYRVEDERERRREDAKTQFDRSNMACLCSLSRPPSLKLLQLPAHDDPAADHVRALPLNHCDATAQPQNNLIQLMRVAQLGMLCLEIPCLRPFNAICTP